MSDRFLRRADAVEIVQKLTVKAVLKHHLIEAGDRILVAVSGGKDSSVLAYALAGARKALKRPYELAALHISTDFCSCCKKTALRQNLESWGIPFDDLWVPVTGRLKPGKKMNCYWCSTQRRMELIAYARQGGFNKIALGHHLDDIIETYFMNMTAAGKLSGMEVKLSYRKYPVTVIRPLAYLEERQIIACADALGLLQAACTCPYGRASARITTRRRIQEFTGGSGAVKRRIFEAFRAASGDKEDEC